MQTTKWFEVNSQRHVELPERALLAAEALRTQANENAGNAPMRLGGTIKNGEWAWVTSGALLQVMTLRNGQMLSSYEFANKYVIKYVEEIKLDGVDASLLAIGLDTARASSGNANANTVALYSIELNALLTCIELPLRISSLAFLGATVCRRTLLQHFDGCIAVGAKEGFVIMLDLNLRSLLTHCEENGTGNETGACHIVQLNYLAISNVQRAFQQCRQENKHFGIKLEVIDGTLCPITCIHPIGATLGLAFGLEDGRLVLYDLVDMQIFHAAEPKSRAEQAPLVKMDHLEPADDPRFCVYICAMHQDEQQLTAALHQVVYERRMLDEEFESHYYEGFQRSCIRLHLPLQESSATMALGCQSIFKEPTLGEDDAATTLWALSWHAVADGKNKLLLLDLNQWYKEEMPPVVLPHKADHFLAGYALCGSQNALHTYVNPSTIVNFHAIQRFEEHFYPNSLTFECSLLMGGKCRYYSCVGVQNKLIHMLRYSNAAIFLDADSHFQKLLNARLLPQFCELDGLATCSKHSKYAVILSVALENNCYSLLLDCAKSWCDGSFIGGFSSSAEITLSTLTDWSWTRGMLIKERCNDICSGIFDSNARPLDQREKQEFGMLTRQLKMLADLLNEVLGGPKSTIPAKALSDLSKRHSMLITTYEYQEILLWLVNIGLLPESLFFHRSISGGLMTFPFHELRKAFRNKRASFKNKNETFISKKTGSCRLIFIDALLEHKCQSDALAELWCDNGGDGLYPPTSMETMLRLMHVPHMDFAEKCAILLYFFLDLHRVLEATGHMKTSVVDSFSKFPSVFKLPPATIKMVEAFWNLDQCCFLAAVDRFISPFNKNTAYPEWMVELFIESLLTQGQPNCALRVLEACPTLISPVLQLRTLLANQLISEAFHLARDKHDDVLMERFFIECLEARHYDVVRDLALTENEGRIIQRILRNNKTRLGESLGFVYLLQKFQYIEASTYMDELQSRAHNVVGNAGAVVAGEAMDTPKLVMSAFNTTMAPLTQRLTDVYFRIRNKIKEADVQSPLPLSCQLIKQNANDLLGGIYHSSALGAHNASHYWGEAGNERKPRLTKSQNAPFLRKAQPALCEADFVEQNEIAYPQPYQVIEKRSHHDAELNNSSDLGDEKQQPRKRRRLLDEELISDLKHFRPTERGEGSTPVIAVRHQERLPTAAGNIELHGILKSNTPEPSSGRAAIRRGTPLDDEKCLRFRLPPAAAPKDSSSDDDEDDDKPDEDEEKVPGKLPEKVAAKPIATTQGYSFGRIFDLHAKVLPIEAKPVSAGHEASLEVVTKTANVASVPRKTVTTAISDKESDANESTEEDFFSPISSPKSPLRTEIARTVERLNSASPNRSFLLGPQPRKPLSSISPPSKLPQGSHSSGFGSFGHDKPTTSAAALKPASTLASRMLDFVPPSCSSRVSETHTKFVSGIKITDRSTIIGGLTFVDSNVKVNSPIDNTSAGTPIESERLLDSTLGMSSYELDVTAQPNLDEKTREDYSSSGREEDEAVEGEDEVDDEAEDVEEEVDDEEEDVEEELEYEDDEVEEVDDYSVAVPEDFSGSSQELNMYGRYDESAGSTCDDSVPSSDSIRELEEDVDPEVEFATDEDESSSRPVVVLPPVLVHGSSSEAENSSNDDAESGDEVQCVGAPLLQNTTASANERKNELPEPDSTIKDDSSSTETTTDDEDDSTADPEEAESSDSSESTDSEETSGSEQHNAGNTEHRPAVVVEATRDSEQNNAGSTEHRPVVVVPVVKNDEDHCFDVSSTDMNNEDSNEASNTALEVADLNRAQQKTAGEMDIGRETTAGRREESVAGSVEQPSAGPVEKPSAGSEKPASPDPVEQSSAGPVEKLAVPDPVENPRAGLEEDATAGLVDVTSAGTLKDQASGSGSELIPVTVKILSVPPKQDSTPLAVDEQTAEKESLTGLVDPMAGRLETDSIAAPLKDPAASPEKQTDSAPLEGPLPVILKAIGREKESSPQGPVEDTEAENETILEPVEELTTGPLKAPFARSPEVAIAGALKEAMEESDDLAAKTEKSSILGSAEVSIAVPLEDPAAEPEKESVVGPIEVAPTGKNTAEPEEESNGTPVEVLAAVPLKDVERRLETELNPASAVEKDAEQENESVAVPVAVPDTRPKKETNAGSVNEPTAVPEKESSAGPEKEPTAGPEKESSAGPVKEPTLGPESSAGPVKEPTAGPEKESSAGPVKEPTAGPEKESSAGPRKEPTAGPEKESSAGTVKEPTAGPEKESSAGPRKEPTAGPEKESSAGPVKEPTAGPEKEPTGGPEKESSACPVKEPTLGPESSAGPVKEPTAGPEIESIASPVEVPTAGRSKVPDAAPQTKFIPVPVEDQTAEPEKESVVEVAPTGPLKDPAGGLKKELTVRLRRQSTASPVQHPTAESEKQSVLEPVEVAPTGTLKDPVGGLKKESTERPVKGANAASEKEATPPVPMEKLTAAPLKEKTRTASMSEDELVLRFEEDDCLPPSPEKVLKAAPEDAKSTRRASQIEETETSPSKRSKLDDKTAATSNATPKLTRLRRRSMAIDSPKPGEALTPRRQTRAQSILSTDGLDSDTPSRNTRARSVLSAAGSTPDRETRPPSVLSETMTPVRRRRRESGASVAASDKGTSTPGRQTRGQGVACDIDSENSHSPQRRLNVEFADAERQARGQSIQSAVGSEIHEASSSRKTRAQSVLSNESNESTPRRIRRATDAAADSTPKRKTDLPIEQPVDETAEAYQTSRRLTRTQQAMMLKAKLASAPSERPPQAARQKRLRTPSTSAPSQHESEDSVGSTSSIHRMRTRGSVRDEQEAAEDDAASEASSVGSRQSSRRNVRAVPSPAPILPAIQEDEMGESAPKRSRTRRK